MAVDPSGPMTGKKFRSEHKSEEGGGRRERRMEGLREEDDEDENGARCVR